MATAQVMKDTELRGLILQAFYDRRQAQSIESPTAGWIDGKTSTDELYRICKQLGDHGLIKWNPFIGGGGVGIITAYGVDVVEGEKVARYSRSTCAELHNQRVKLGQCYCWQQQFSDSCERI